MITDDEYIQQLHISLKRSYDLAKERTQMFMNNAIPLDKINDNGFQISNKSDFMKGYAVCLFYMLSNSLDKAAEMLNVQQPNNAAKIKEDLQDVYSKKLCNDLDIQH